MMGRRCQTWRRAYCSRLESERDPGLAADVHSVGPLGIRNVLRMPVCTICVFNFIFFKPDNENPTFRAAAGVCVGVRFIHVTIFMKKHKADVART